MITTSHQAAVLTPRGRGAVAVIRVAGDAAIVDRAATPVFCAANGGPLAAQPLGRIVFGRWGRETVEDVVVCRIDQATWEIHCHGGDRAVERIVNDLRSLGATIVSWQEMEAAAADELAAELQEQLSRAITWRTAEYLLHQAQGGLRSALDELAEIEWTSSGRARARSRIDELLRWANFGIHLTQPWRVVLTGRPNVGKSSLINALLGYQRSIVFDQPGTTRDVVTAVTAFDGWPVQLTDTAGLRDEADALEAEGIARARRQLAEADLVVKLIDLGEEPENGEWQADSASLLVAHKCDLPDRWGAALPANSIRVSSVTQAGLAELQREIVRRLIPELPEFAKPIPVTPRQVQLLDSLREALAAEDREDEYRACFQRSSCGRFHELPSR